MRVEGIPQGVWLVELEQARAELRHVDDVLRRLMAAIVASHNGMSSGFDD